ncbi:MAG: adenylyl-sulfate kinase [Polyangiaceae bacterium]|nr:adenylyl-sulfate kinase [Polyangiaceae bacterium]
MSGAVVWITGMPSSGKSTFAELLAGKLRGEGRSVAILDGDRIRGCVVPTFGYEAVERENFYRTLANLAAYLEGQGLLVLVPATAHAARYREVGRALAKRYVEVHIDVPQAVAQERDAKGLYGGVRAGKVRAMPGADLEYEPPSSPDVVASGGQDAAAIQRVSELLGLK